MAVWELWCETYLHENEDGEVLEGKIYTFVSPKYTGKYEEQKNELLECNNKLIWTTDTEDFDKAVKEKNKFLGWD